MTATERNFKYLGLFIVLALPVYITVYHATGPLSVSRVLTSESILWLIFFGLLACAKYGENDPVKFSGNGMGFFKTMGLAAIVLFSTILIMLLYALVCLVIFKMHPPKEDLITQIMKLPNWIKILLVTRAGVIEETFFRAYAMTRIMQLSNNRFLAFSVPLIAFTLGHVAYGSVYHVLATFFIGLVLAIYYWKTRNLASNIIAHSVYDCLGMIRIVTI